VNSLLISLLLACRSGPSGEAPGARPSDGDTALRPTDAPVEALPSACEVAGWPSLRLNELVAANLEGIADEDGDRPDWLELWNPSETPVELTGWALEPEGGEPWPLPSPSLGAGAHWLIFASGKDRPGDPTAGLAPHSPFKLPAESAGLRLLAPDGCAIDSARPERLYGDVSFGHPLSDDTEWAYFLEPTPGAPNETESRPGFAAPPSLSPGGGAYAAGLTVEATSVEAEATLRYTLQGDEPDEGAPEAAGPIPIDAASRPIPLRVRAFVPGLWPSRITTATYTQGSAHLAAGMKAVFLTSDPEGLFSDETGIYAFGDSYEPDYPYFGANFWEDWERPVHVEIWEPDGEKSLDAEAGISIHGGYTRAFDQKSLRLYARSAYGEDSFDGDFFPREGERRYGSLVLQIGMDWCSTHIIEPFADELFRDARGARLDSIDIAAWEPTQVWINGHYWGYYNLRERMDPDYIENHHGLDPEALDRMELGWTSAPHWQLEQGDWEAFDTLNAYVLAHDLSDPAAYTTFTTMVDAENLATTVLAEAYMGNTDWWWNNLRLWRPHTVEGRFRWFVYDLGHGWVSPGFDQLGTSVTWTGDGLPISAPLANDRFRDELANQAADLLSTSADSAEAVRRFDALAARVAPAMSAQLDRWCGGAPLSAWEANRDYARGFVSARGPVLREQVRNHLALSGDVTLSLATNEPDAATFDLSLVEVEAPYSGLRYRGVPLTVTALPAEGWVFTGWSDASLGDTPTVTLPLGANTTLTALLSPARGEE
jgi:hypothetical protein